MKIKKISLAILFLFYVITQGIAQKQFEEDQELKNIATIYKDILINSKSHDWLHYLCKKIGGRVGGSPEYAAAVDYTSFLLDSIGVDTVWTQAVEVPYWRRGAVEKATIINSSHLGRVELAVAALGFSAGTDERGITTKVIEVKSFEELTALDSNEVKGNIIFFNRPMEMGRINSFHAYGAAASQRTNGPRAAAKLGAAAVIIRSLTVKYDDVPHSGVTMWGKQTAIPAVGIGLKSADLLSDLLHKEKDLKINISLSCQNMGKRIAYTVIGEIKGTEKPDEIILVGGHLDSWDIGEGAHDDGAGCVQAIDVLHTYTRLGIKPKHTLRCVLFASEEIGIYGGIAYARVAKEQALNHIAAIESDAGGHIPIGFKVDAMKGVAKNSFEKVKKWRSIFSSLGVWNIQAGGSAADVSRLKDQGTVLFGYRPDSQRYFDYHHAKTDVWERVHRRELILGTGAIFALVYLIDNYGIK